MGHRHCHHHHHGTAQATPQMTTNGADCSSHGRYSISVVLPRLPVLEWTESRPLRPTRLPEVPRNRKIRHCHHHHGTAQTTPQMTTNGADCSSCDRYSISQWCCRDWPCPSRPRAGRCDPRDCRKCHGTEKSSTATTTTARPRSRRR